MTKGALNRHKQLLLEKRERLDNLIHLINDTLEGVKTMSFKEFDTSKIDAHKEQYAKEVKERWGETDAYKESARKTKNYSKEKWEMLNQESAAIFQAFSEHKEEAPDSDIVMQLVKRWQDYITANYYTCTKEILASLGLMYVADERFKDNIDQVGEGTAAFMSAAIVEYCK